MQIGCWAVKNVGICKYLNLIKPTICHSAIENRSVLGCVIKEFAVYFLFCFTCKNVLPSSRNKRNGTSKSIALRNSVHPLVARYCAPDTAHIGALMPANSNQTKHIHLNSIPFHSIQCNAKRRSFMWFSVRILCIWAQCSSSSSSLPCFAAIAAKLRIYFLAYATQANR